MAVNTEADFEGEIDGDYTTCFMAVEGEIPPESVIERWIMNSGYSRFMTPSVDCMLPIEGIGNLPMSFWSGKDWVKAILPDVAQVPLLGYNLLSLKMMADRGHKYVGEKKGVTLLLKTGNDNFGPSVGKLNCLSGFRRPLEPSDFALATITPGKIPSVSPVDINTFYEFHGHIHEKWLRSAANQLGVVLEGTLRECEGC